MKLLAVDTALDACSVALLTRDGERIDVVAVEEIIGRGHAERLMQTVAAVMAKAGVALAEVDAFAVTVGPGSFTGIRVGVAAVRGFALATGRPAVGVATLDVLADAARALAPGRAIAAVIDARKDEVYCGLFAADGTALDRPAVVPIAEAAARARACDAILVGSGAPLLRAVEPALVASEAAPLPAIAAVARLGLARLDACGAAGCAAPSPLYVRPPDAKPQDGARLARLDPGVLLAEGAP